MKTTVYMADLRHNFGGVLWTDSMPLGVGYMKAVMDRELAEDTVDSRIFAYPDKLMTAIDNNPPDILMLSNYMWNESLSLFFLRYVKKANPNVLTVMGGPNMPVESERQLKYLDDHPEIDIFILGEADYLATEIVKLFSANDAKVSGLGEQLPSCLYRDSDGVVCANEQWPRNGGGDINDIPSPWLTGVMDEFFDGKLSPLWETNRGCPFKCSFCVQGTKYYNKITMFDMDRIKAEIDYIGRMIQKNAPETGMLRIVDANYGMYERDVEISSYIGEAQRDYGWPTYIDATTGKNKPERIIESMEKVNGALVLYQAVQSLDDTVLKNIKRSNIKLDAYEKMAIHVRGRGLRSSSDLILGLPGETKKTHLDALHKLIDAGTQQIHCFQAMMIKGSELDTDETREKFHFDTRFRVMPKNYSDYDGERVFDLDEIVVATDTLSFEEYLECRHHHLTFSIFWNDSWFLEVTEMARKKFGIANSEWLAAMVSAWRDDTGESGEMYQAFETEARNELFPSQEAAVEFYKKDENFARMLKGEVGDNLMYKYRAKASFFVWDSVCELAMETTRSLLLAKGAAEQIEGFDELWTDFASYTHAKHASGRSPEEICSPVSLKLSYDIQRWIDDDYPLVVSSYHYATPVEFKFSMTEDAYSEVLGALKVWTCELNGLVKMVTKIRRSSMVRHCEWADTQAAPQPSRLIARAVG